MNGMSHCTDSNHDHAQAIHTFSIEGRKFVMDANSSNFLEIDDLAEVMLELYVSGKSMQDIHQQLSGRYGEEVVSAAIKELDGLISKRILFADDQFMAYEPDPNTGISSICLMISHDCNLRCKYCYAESGSFGRERMLMSRVTAEKAVDFLFKHCGANSLLSISFHGGEPLLNLDVMKHTVEYAHKLASRDNKEVGFGITTNGTLLTKSVRDYFLEKGISLMISLDGRPDVNDKMRVFTDGRGSYDIVFKNLVELLKNPASSHFSIRGTMTRGNIDLVGTVKHLASIGCKDISVEPCISSDEKLGIRDENIGALKEEYTKLAREYIRAAKKGENLPFYQFEYVMEQIGHADMRMISCGAGTSYMAVTADGGLYPCHRLVSADDYRFGDVYEGINRPEVPRLFMNTHVNKKGKCSSCWARYVCGGGCRAYAINFNKNISEPYTVDCELVKHGIELGAYIHSELKTSWRHKGTNRGQPCSI